jgi:hypothetical protein
MVFTLEFVASFVHLVWSGAPLLLGLGLVIVALAIPPAGVRDGAPETAGITAS